MAARFLSVKVPGKKETASSTRQSFTIAWPRCERFTMQLSPSLFLAAAPNLLRDRPVDPVFVVTSPDLHPFPPLRPLVSAVSF